MLHVYTIFAWKRKGGIPAPSSHVTVRTGTKVDIHRKMKWWKYLFSNLNTFYGCMKIYLAFVCNLANYVHKGRPFCRGRFLCKDTTRFWNDIGKSQHQFCTFQSFPQKVLIHCVQKNKNLDIRIEFIFWGRKNKIWLCICQDGKTPQHGYERVRSHPHTGSLRC